MSSCCTSASGGSTRLLLSGIRTAMCESFRCHLSTCPTDNLHSFCFGDATHRHPPANGLGSNTCIQDAFNLAWKLALVLQGKAHPTLLDSFNAERQPVGHQIVKRANKSMMLNATVWDLLGAGTRGDSTERRLPAVQTREARDALRRALDAMKYEQHAHGVE